MKKLFIVLVLFVNSLLAQENSSDDAALNLSKSGSTPGFSILDLSPSSVDRPKDPTDFAVFLQNATDNFTSFPKNYALEFSPWLLANYVKNFSQFQSDANVLENFKQSFTISIAASTKKWYDSQTEFTRMGIGGKFSIKRGNIIDELRTFSKDIQENKKAIDNVDLALIKGNDLFVQLTDTEQENDSELKTLKDKINTLTDKQERVKCEKLISDRIAFLHKIVKEKFKEKYKDKIKELSEQASKLDYIRKGFKWDVAFALAYDFKSQNFEERELSKYAVWTTISYDLDESDANNNSSFLFTGKALNSPNLKDTVTCSCGESKIFDSKTEWELGARFIKDFSKVSLSAEIVYKKGIPKPKWLIDFGYTLSNNKVLQFSFGKDFDGSDLSGKNNLIAAINLLLGFGSKRPLN